MYIVGTHLNLLSEVTVEYPRFKDKYACLLAVIILLYNNAIKLVTGQRISQSCTVQATAAGIIAFKED